MQRLSTQRQPRVTKEVIVREGNSQEKVKELLRGCVIMTESRVKAELFHWIHINMQKECSCRSEEEEVFSF